MLSLLILVNIMLFYFVGAGFKASRRLQLIALGSEICNAIPFNKLDEYRTDCIGTAPFSGGDQYAEWTKERDAFNEKWANIVGLVTVPDEKFLTIEVYAELFVFICKHSHSSD